MNESSLEKLKIWANGLNKELFVLYLAWRHPRTPWYVKVLVIAVVAYALSPIDLIPDFIPVLGYLDDLILLPIGIFFTIKAIPPEVLAECRAIAADGTRFTSKAKWVASGIVVLVWISAAAWIVWRLLRDRT